MGESQLIDVATWKAATREGKAPGDVYLVKPLKTAEIKAVEGAGRKLAWIISSGARDRDNDTLNPKGWDWKAWTESGAPVLWAHNSRTPPYNVPIATGETPKLVEGGKLRSVADFGEPGIYAFADMIYELARPRDGGRVLRRMPSSVGFIPKTGAFNEQTGGYDFDTQEGLEWSIVPVMSNRDSIQEAKSLGIDLKPMREYAEWVLDCEEPGLWVPNERALEAFKALAEPRIVVPAFDPGPFVAAAQSACEKRGRVLSTANESRIRTASDAATAIGAALDEVLAQVGSEAEPEKAFEPFILIEPAPAEPTFLIDPNHVRAAMGAAVSDTVRAAVSAARGRLD